ncbi:MAG: CusA/CzcA family heavy metal efflux RND transporter [Bacteroidia bacterium]
MLDKIIAYSIKNKIVIGVLTLFLIIWGIWSLSKLPIDAVPDITNNQVQIITTCPTLAGQEVEQLVTYPIERTMSNLPDLTELRSVSRFGLSVVTVVFDDDVDIYFARQIISERLKEAESKIPNGVGSPELAPVSTGLGEIYQYVIHPAKGSENKYSAMDLRSMQDWIVARQLYGTKGIAEVNSFGGQLKQYEVAINPTKLLAMNVTIADVFNALKNNNENTGGAYIDKKPNAYFIRGVGLVHSFEDIKNCLVKNNPNGIPILIKDVAEVRFGSAVRYGAMTYNGEKDVVGGVIMMLKGENSADVVNRIKEKMITIKKSLPQDVIIEPFLDRRDLVERAISTVSKNLIEGALIVIFVLVLFLGNIRAGLIVASAIPIAMLFAIALMNVFGVSANLMSLGAIDFGLIVDGAVIIVEATMHHLAIRKTIGRLTQSEMDEEVYNSASKIRNSAAFGEIIILIVYIPILTMVGIEGKMFKPMAQTVGFAILGALILSLTYIPMMCALFLPKTISTTKSFSDKLMDLAYRIYLPILNSAIKFKKFLIGLTISLFCLSIILFSRMGGEFIPNLDEGDFAFHCILPQGTSLSQSIETSMQAMRILKSFDEVKLVVGKTGSAEIPTDPMPPEATDMVIILKPHENWKRNISYQQLADEMIDKLKVLPGVFFEKNQPIQMRFNELMTGIRQDVAIKIFGEDLDTLLNYANKVSAVIQGIRGATNPMVERVEGLPQIVIKYNRIQMANYGINIDDVNSYVSTAFAGGIAGVVFENERRFDLVVRLDSAYRTKIEDVNNLYIPAKNGVQIPLSQIAEIKMELGPAQISREDGKRRIVIGFNLKDRDVESVVADVKLKLDNLKLPNGYFYKFGGTFENLQLARNRLLIALPIALLLIFSLLYFTFNSIKQAILIFAAIPMSVIGGVFALLIRDMPFSISAGIGFIALFGVAVLNGIVLIGTFNQLEKEGVINIIDRIKTGTKNRLRPVLMTATVASLGFFPMAFSNGAGAEVQKPLATVVIGGLISATILTLFILPLLYYFFSSNLKSKINSKLVVVFFIFILPINFKAQSNLELTLDDAITLALKNNFEIKSQQHLVKSYQYLKKSAFELPKTTVNMQYGQYNSVNQDLGFNFSQGIPFPTFFVAKSKLYNAQANSAILQEQITINDVKNQVKSFYYQILFLEQKKKLMIDLNLTYAEFTNTANLKYTTGETNLLEKTTSDAKFAQIKLQLQQIEAELNEVVYMLKSIININENFALKQIIFEPLEISTAFDTSLIMNNPRLKSMYNQIIIADKTKKLESSLFLPDLLIGYFNQSLMGIQNINGQDVYFNRSNRFTGVNAGISVPLTFFSNTAKIKSLNQQKLAIENETSNEKIKLQANLQVALLKYNQALQKYNYYKSVGTNNANIILQTAKTSFKSNVITYVEYLQAIETFTQIQLGYYEVINQINQEVININYLINK